MERNLLLKGASLSTERGILPQGDVLVAGGVIRAVAETLPFNKRFLSIGTKKRQLNELSRRI